MKLSRSETQAWLDDVGSGYPLSKITELAGIPRFRVAQQLTRNSVAPSTVTAIARGLSLSPLNELSRFQDFSSLCGGDPTAHELPVFIQTAPLLIATANRLNHVRTDEVDLGNEYYDLLALYWVEAADNGDLRRYLQQHLKISQPTLWKMLRSRLREDVGLAIAHHAGFTPISALVVAGVLTGAEAGWSSDIRSQWINTVPLGQLLEVTEARLHEAGKHERSRETFEDRLG